MLGGNLLRLPDTRIHEDPFFLTDVDITRNFNPSFNNSLF